MDYIRILRGQTKWSIIKKRSIGPARSRNGAGIGIYSAHSCRKRDTDFHGVTTDFARRWWSEIEIGVAGDRYRSLSLAFGFQRFRFSSRSTPRSGSRCQVRIDQLGVFYQCKFLVWMQTWRSSRSSMHVTAMVNRLSRVEGASAMLAGASIHLAGTIDISDR